MNESFHSSITIAISGAADTLYCGEDAMSVAKNLGREVAHHNAILLTGATGGFPLWAAMGAKEAGGTVVGFSPASNEREHRETYRLPVEALDLKVYTGFGYSGRDLLMTRSADGVLFGCGKIGSIQEFTVAFEEKKPIGVLEGDWKTDEMFKEILKQGGEEHEHVLFDKDPRRLVERLIKMVKQKKN